MKEGLCSWFYTLGYENGFGSDDVSPIGVRNRIIDIYAIACVISGSKENIFW